MKPFSVFMVIPFCLLQIQPACADCAEINKHASVWRAAFILAKEDYTRDTAVVVGRPASEETIAIGIASNVKMKVAIDGLIEILDRSMAEGCFGGDATVWRDVIAKLKEERDAIEKTIRAYLDKRDANANGPQ